MENNKKKLKIRLLSVNEELCYWCLDDETPLVWVLTRWKDEKDTTSYNDRVLAYHEAVKYAVEHGFDDVEMI